MKWFMFFICFCCVTGNMYIRIDPFEVADRIIQFLEYHKINNCFERLEGEDELHLKCLRDGGLIDVHVLIDEEFYI